MADWGAGFGAMLDIVASKVTLAFFGFQIALYQQIRTDRPPFHPL